MKISKIDALNFKGQSFSQSLCGVTVIAGANFVGKSSRLEAMTLALCGKLPGTAATNQDIYHTVFGGRDGAVCATTDAGAIYSRRYTKRGDSVKCDVGGLASEPVPTMAFDHGEFFSLSSRERTKLLFRSLPPPPLDKVGPDVVVANLKNVKLEPHTEQAESVINGLCQWVRDTWVKYAKPFTVQEALANLTEESRVKCNDAKAVVKRMEATALGVTQLQEPDAASLASAERERDSARRELDKAQQEHAQAVQRWKTAKSALDTAEATAKSYVEPEPGARERLEKRVADLRKLASDTGEVKQAPSGDAPDAKAQRKAVQDAGSMLREAEGNKIAADREVTRLEVELAAAEHATVCSTCGQSIVELQKEVAKNLKAAIKTAKSVRTKCDGIHTSKSAVCAVAMANLENAEAAERDYYAAENRRQEEVRKLQAEREQLANDTRLAESQLKALNDAAALAEPARQARESLVTLRGELAKCETTGKELKEMVASVNTRWQQADQNHRKAMADASAAREANKAVAAAQKAEVEAKVTAQLYEFLLELSAKCVEQSVGPLVTLCNQLNEGVLSAPVVFSDGDVGLNRGQFVPFKACSDGEQVAIAAALRVALATTSPAKIATVARFESLDRSVRRAFITNAVAMVHQGILDQVLIIEVNHQPLRDYEDFFGRQLSNDLFGVVQIGM